MRVEIVMPKMGESIFEGTIVRWVKKTGERIEKDETILEISTDKVDSEIPSPAKGVLSKILVEEQQTVQVGTVIAYIETEARDSEQQFQQKEPPPPGAEPPPLEPGSPSVVPFSDRVPPQERHRFYSPLVRMIAKKEGLDRTVLDRIAGSGLKGRVTKQDVVNFLQLRTVNTPPAAAGEKSSALRTGDFGVLRRKYPEPMFNLVRMEPVQKKMAEHMMRSVSTSPHVNVIDEVDLTEIVNFRLSILYEFEKQTGFKLTFMPFIASAVIGALKEFPIVNSTLEGDIIIYKNFINLGIAVAAPNGLIVPVVRHADKMDFHTLASSMNDVAVRARSKKLLPDDVMEGTFSVTNYGVFGNLIGTPIINQPQAAILGIGAVKKRAIVLSDDAGYDSMGIRSMAYLTLAFDHRIIDGAIGGQFLTSIKRHLEHFDFHLVK
ncbi:MAG: 2-oxo acid dehydrogenase subunit E2 [Ignavibacteriae bacterium]|nr:MAG: 2-oxo acid dehydrogenase subunit E2 [Ignavibacteriota bacterium]